MAHVNSSPEFEDGYGFATLDTLSSADKFNRWMFSVIDPHCHGEILEIGGGIGNLSAQFLKAGKSLTVTELKEEYCEIIRERLSGSVGLRNVIRMDIAAPDFGVRYKDLMGHFDSLFALNVLEHIEDRHFALGNCRKLLKPGGTLVILVPAYQSLYNRFDKFLGHYLRFTKRSLIQVMTESGFKVVHQSYFNFIGIFGWWFSGSVLKKQMIPQGQMTLFNTFVPVFRLVDRVICHKAGLSVIAVGKNES